MAAVAGVDARLGGGQQLASLLLGCCMARRCSPPLPLALLRRCCKPALRIGTSRSQLRPALLPPSRRRLAGCRQRAVVRTAGARLACGKAASTCGRDGGRQRWWAQAGQLRRHLQSPPDHTPGHRVPRTTLPLCRSTHLALSSSRSRFSSLICCRVASRLAAVRTRCCRGQDKAKKGTLNEGQQQSHACAPHDSSTSQLQCDDARRLRTFDSCALRSWEASTCSFSCVAAAAGSASAALHSSSSAAFLRQQTSTTTTSQAASALTKWSPALGCAVLHVHLPAHAGKPGGRWAAVALTGSSASTCRPAAAPHPRRPGPPPGPACMPAAAPCERGQDAARAPRPLAQPPAQLLRHQVASSPAPLPGAHTGHGITRAAVH